MTVSTDNSKTGIPTRNPYILAQSGVAVILPSSGSSNATGQITFTTALASQPSGTVGLYLPTGVITAGSQGTGAGVYQVTFSSTTVCQVAGTGITSANGAYTQTTAADLTLLTISVPGASMGANGSLRSVIVVSTLNSVNVKTVVQKFGGTNFLSSAQSGSGAIQLQLAANIRNRGSQSVQVCSSLVASSYGTGGGVVLPGAVDTSTAQNLITTAQLAVATDYVILEGYTVEVLPNP